MVDKNLFLHDLAIVAILKNEGAYIKEWLDYHLLAGVDHFYLYDNDSTDHQTEVAKPYVKAGLVDYFPAPGEAMQYAVYNDAVKRFKFHCRYMAFIDADEFIFPKTSQSIVDVVDEILSNNLNAAGLAINWQIFGSNGQTTADLSRGVLERFTRRAHKDWFFTDSKKCLNGNVHVKTIANPRTINNFRNPHFAEYFGSCRAVNENGKFVKSAFNEPVTVDKIAVNHYYAKSRSEFADKMQRGRADINFNTYRMKNFEDYDRNEVFDDGILKYRDSRTFTHETDAQKLQRVTETLTKILSGEKFSLETALTCRALSNHLGLKVHEETAVTAILNSLDGLKIAEGYMFIRDLPNLLSLPYPSVKYLREVAVQIISHLMKIARLYDTWQRYFELDYLLDILKLVNR